MSEEHKRRYIKYCRALPVALGSAVEIRTEVFPAAAAATHGCVPWRSTALFKRGKVAQRTRPCVPGERGRGEKEQ